MLFHKNIMFNKFQITEILLYMCTNHSSNKLKTGINKIPMNVQIFEY